MNLIRLSRNQRYPFPMKKAFFFLFSILLIVITLLSNQLYLSHILSAYLGKKIPGEVKIQKASCNIKDTLVAWGIVLDGAGASRSTIEKARVAYDLKSLLKGTLNLDLQLKNVKLAYQDSGLMRSITEALSIDGTNILDFHDIRASVSRKGNIYIIESLEAEGNDIRVYFFGTIGRDSMVDFSFKVLLSDEVVSTIPEATRKVFFKKNGKWTELDLYITGEIRRPTVNFSTDLFKLRLN